MIRSIDDLFGVSGRDSREDSQSVISLVRRWAEKEVIGKRLEYYQNYASLFDEKRKILALSMGLQRLAVVEDRGGFGWHTPDHAIDVLSALSEIGRADSSTGVLLAMNYAMFSVLNRFSEGREELLKAISASYQEDELRTPSCILTGAGFAGHDTPLFKGRSILAEATVDTSGATISCKNLRPFAAGLTADMFLTVCADRSGLPCLALVPGDAGGIRRGDPVKTTGLNALGNAEVTFDKVKIPQENFIHDPGAVQELFTSLNLFLGGVSLGAGMNFFEILSDWSDSRVIKGSIQLKENPLCASVLADVAEEVACSKLLLEDLARLMPPARRPGSLSAEGIYTYSAMIGARAQQGIMRAINRGLELMGSAGYAKEWHAEKHWRDVKTIQSLLYGVAAEAPVKMDIARFFYDCREL